MCVRERERERESNFLVLHDVSVSSVVKILHIHVSLFFRVGVLCQVCAT